MSTVSDAVDALAAGMEQVAGVRVYRSVGAVVDPPAAVIGPPTLTWGAYCAEPTSARFDVYVVVNADDWAGEAFFGLAPAVAKAVDGVPDAALAGAAEPGTYQSGGTTLPAYHLTVEVGL
ncbi:MAG: hypothetical protein ACRDMV_07540 [Streptosporangiales bacterium]